MNIDKETLQSILDDIETVNRLTHKIKIRLLYKNNNTEMKLEKMKSAYIQSPYTHSAKVALIKDVRNILHCSLMQAKNIVETWEAEARMWKYILIKDEL